jgi:IPT/TIG domain-containing protein
MFLVSLTIVLAGSSGRALGQGSLTTSDGMTLGLTSAGSVSTLKFGSTNYAGSLASGFFYRELAPTTSNLVSNGSFESGSSTPTNWTISGGTGGTWSIDATTASAGTRSMKVYISGTTPKHSPDLVSSNIPILPDTPYTVSYNVKTSALSYGLTIFIYEVDALGNSVRHSLGSSTGTAGWLSTPLSLSFVSGANASHVYCDAFIYNGYGTAWLDDVKLVDVFGGNLPINFTGTVTSSGGVLTQTASKNNLNLSATFTNVGSAVKVDATLTDTTGTDRAIELAYKLPLNVPGWTWDDDFVTPITIAANTRYQYLVSGFGPAQSHSLYPFANVHNASASFALAVPMGPQMNRLSYDTGDGLRSSWDLGLSPAATKTPSRATVSFWIYTATPQWGLRATAAKYYASNPGSFTSATTRTGSWVLANTAPLTSVPNPQDFGWAFEEGDGDYALDQAHGILGLHYVDPSAWFRPFPGWSSQPPYSTLINTLLNDVCCGTGTTVDSTPVTEMAAAVVNSSPYDAAGNYEVLDNPYFWYNSYAQVYPVSPDPDIPAPSMYGVIRKYRVDNRIALAQSRGYTLGGIFLDDLTWVFSSLENSRRSLWAYSNSPLSFSYSSRQVTLLNGFSMGEFTSAMKAYVHSKGLVLTGSITPGDYVWFAQDLDEMGGEVTDSAESFSRAYARRTLSYGKPWSNLFVSHSTAPTASQVLGYLRQALLLGFFPGFNGAYWDDSTAYERDRPLFKQYIPLIQKEATAGWQPITYVTSSDPATLVERFGNSATGTFFISAQNTGTTTTSVQLSVDGTGLGISAAATVTARELVSNTVITVTRSGGNLILSDSFAASETSLYELSVSTTSPPPSIGAVTPSTGPTGGGTSVSISGTNFHSGLSVSIGGVSASVTSMTSTSISATTGAHTAGTVHVVVTNSDSQSSTLPNGYTYISSPPTATKFYTLTPCRAIDTRNPAGPRGGPALAAGSTRTFSLTGTCGIPANASALAVNVTVTQGGRAGLLTAYPAGSAMPLASLINYSAGQTRANNGVLPLGSGSLSVHCAQSAGTVHFILDVSGYFQ